VRSVSGIWRLPKADARTLHRLLGGYLIVPSRPLIQAAERAGTTRTVCGFTHYNSSRIDFNQFTSSWLFFREIGGDLFGQQR
jgi:hypothetical protein